jgi:hypothetical protein
MKAWKLLAVGAILAAAIVAAPMLAQDKPTTAAAPDAQVVGISVAKPGLNAKPGETTMAGLPGGTWMYLALVRKDKTFSMLENDTLKVTSFTDDFGTDLLKPEAGNKSPLAQGYRIVDNGRTCILLVGSSRMPGLLAKSLKLKGSATFVCGSDEKSAQIKDVTFRKDATMNIGNLEATVVAVTQTAAGQVVTLMSESDLAVVKSFVVQADGREFKSEKSSSPMVTIGPKKMHVLNLAFDGKFESGNVSTTYFNKIERLTLSLDSEAGLAL